MKITTVALDSTTPQTITVPPSKYIRIDLGVSMFLEFNGADEIAVNTAITLGPLSDGQLFDATTVRIRTDDPSLGSLIYY